RRAGQPRQAAHACGENGVVVSHELERVAGAGESPPGGKGFAFPPASRQCAAVSRLPGCRNDPPGASPSQRESPAVSAHPSWHAVCIESAPKGGWRMKRFPTEETEDRLPGLFEPQTILPVQYFTRLQRSAAWTGEQRLMAAILEDAVAVCGKRTVPRT